MTIEVTRIEARLKRRIDVPIEWDAMDALETPTNLAVYFALTRMSLAENNCAPGVEALARMARVSRATLMRSLKELERKGVIVRTKTKLDNGMQGRTIFSVMGTDVVEYEPVLPRGSHGETPAVSAPQSHSETPRGETRQSHGETPVVAGDSGSGLMVRPQQMLHAVSSKQQHAGLVDRLVAVGVDRHSARRLVEERAEECVRQLEALPRRKAGRNPAGLLRRAIEEAWSLPVDVMPVVSMLPVVEESREVCAGCDNLRNVEEGGEWIRCPDCNPQPVFA